MNDIQLTHALKNALTSAKQAAQNLYAAKNQLLAEHAYPFIEELVRLEMKASRILTIVEDDIND